MDFGDILEQWDQKQKKIPAKQNQVSHKKANAPEKKLTYDDLMEQQGKIRINPMDMWLNRFGVVDKDKINESIQKQAQFHDIDYLKKMPPDATIDLHQLTKDEAWSRLNHFVTDCVSRGFRKILIIHGKGIHSNGSDPVLGPAVRLFIEQDKRMGTSGHPDRNHGGNGATWVLIKDSARN